jgi:dTDP-4-dehydrorhamnose 3,5-epimerase
MASKTKGTVQEIFIGRDNYGLVRIPPLVWYGFQSVGQGEAVIANCIDLPHDPAESETKDINTRDIPYVF